MKQCKNRKIILRRMAGPQPNGLPPDLLTKVVLKKHNFTNLQYKEYKKETEKVTEIKKNRFPSLSLSLSSLRLFKAGFTLIEMIIVLAIIGILAALAYSTLRTPIEKIACKNIFSVMQLAKMRAVATGYNIYVDFDMNGGSVSDKFYTVYLDTDNDKAFGENNNANGDNEFTESHFAMQDTSGGYPGVALPGGVDFGLPITNPPSLTPTGYAFSAGVLSDGVSFAGGSGRIKFLPKGMPSGFGGSVYVYNTEDSIRGCAVVVALTGIIRMWTWDGSKWGQ